MSDLDETLTSFTLFDAYHSVASLFRVEYLIPNDNFIVLDRQFHLTKKLRWQVLIRVAIVFWPPCIYTVSQKKNKTLHSCR